MTSAIKTEPARPLPSKTKALQAAYNEQLAEVRRKPTAADGNLCASFAFDRNFRSSPEIDAGVEFLSVEGESPSFFRGICEAEYPPVDDKRMVVCRVVDPGPLNRVDDVDLGGTSQKWIIGALVG